MMKVLVPFHDLDDLNRYLRSGGVVEGYALGETTHMRLGGACASGTEIWGTMTGYDGRPCRRFLGVWNFQRYRVVRSQKQREESVYARY